MESCICSSEPCICSSFAATFKRIFQIIGACLFSLIFIFLPPFCLSLTIYLLFFTSYWWLAVLYLAWMYWDRDVAAHGKRPGRWFRNQRIWHHFAKYFPMKLVKTAELPADRNYIFGAHPHGVLSAANFTSFSTNGTGFEQLFPGLRCSVVTLPSMFFFPLHREIVVASGAIKSDRASIDYVLNGDDGRGETGRVVCIVVGGAEEALDSHSDNFDLTLKKRRGFIKLALKHGASLVPVYHFGETSVYYQVPNERGSRLRYWQNMFKRIFGFSPPIFHGRGFGPIPYRTPVHTVVGAPIAVDRCENPTLEQISELHSKYCAALTELFDSHKTKYGIDKATRLNIR